MKVAGQIVGVVGIVALVILASITALSLWAKRFYDNISFTFKVDKSKINLQSILSQLSLNQTASVPVKIIIDNNNNQGLTLKDVYVKVSYLGRDVLQTDKNSVVLKQINIPANTKGFQVNDSVQVFANLSAVKLIQELIQDNKPEVDVFVSGKIFGIKREFSFKQILEL